MITQRLQEIFSSLTQSRNNHHILETPAATTPAALNIQDLHKEFVEAGTSRSVLDGVNFAVKRGDFVALLGHSGSGKSTLLNLLSGIERPTSGQITVAGVPITSLRDRERTLFRRDHIGIIFQFFHLIPNLTVLENVTLPQELAGVDRRIVETPALNLLERVGLRDRRDTYPDKLSGGEQQRVAIARALVHDPQLVLADEPTGNLDETTGDFVLKLLLDLTRDQGKTLMMATHNPQIARMADRVLRVHEGIVTEEVAQVGDYD